MKKDYSVEFSTWHTNIGNIPIVVYDNGNIEFDCDGRQYMDIQVFELQSLLAHAQSFIHARREFKKNMMPKERRP